MSDSDIPRRAHPIADVVGRVDQRLSGEVTSPDALSTGFPSIDRILGGGFRRRDLIVLGGDVGSGKSSLALAMALRVAERGERVAFMTGEMDEDRLWERALASEARVKLDDIRRGNLADETRAAIGAAALRLRSLPLRVISPAGQSFSAIAEQLARASTAFTVVDYLQLLPPALEERTHEEEMAYAVRRLKEVAAIADTALLLIAQLPKHDPRRRDPRPELDDFGALGAVKYHADVVLGLYREEMYQMARGVEGATELIVAKNRHGSTSFIDLYFYAAWMRFEDMIEPDR